MRTSRLLLPSQLLIFVLIAATVCAQSQRGPGTSVRASTDCSSSAYAKAAALLGNGDIDGAYGILQKASCPESDAGIERIRVLMVIVSASETAAYLGIGSILNTKEEPSPSFVPLVADIANAERRWAGRLLSDSNRIAKLRQDHEQLALDKFGYAEARKVQTAVTAFEGTSQKLKSGVRPSDAQWHSYESLTGLMFFSSAVAHILGVATKSEGNLAYLLIWMEKGLSGNAAFQEVRGLAGSLILADAQLWDTNVSRDAELLNRYTRAYELCSTAAKMLPPDRSGTSKDCQEAASERISSLKH